jgi:hypothetical protein
MRDALGWPHAIVRTLTLVLVVGLPTAFSRFSTSGLALAARAQTACRNVFGLPRYGAQLPQEPPAF